MNKYALLFLLFLLGCGRVPPQSCPFRRLSSVRDKDYVKKPLPPKIFEGFLKGTIRYPLSLYARYFYTLEGLINSGTDLEEFLYLNFDQKQLKSLKKSTYYFHRINNVRLRPDHFIYQGRKFEDESSTGIIHNFDKVMELHLNQVRSQFFRMILTYHIKNFKEYHEEYFIDDHMKKFSELKACNASLPQNILNHMDLFNRHLPLVKSAVIKINKFLKKSSSIALYDQIIQDQIKKEKYLKLNDLDIQLFNYIKQNLSPEEKDMVDGLFEHLYEGMYE